MRCNFSECFITYISSPWYARGKNCLGFRKVLKWSVWSACGCCKVWMCAAGRGGGITGHRGQLSASGGSLAPQLAELSRPAASDLRKHWQQLREGHTIRNLVFLGKLHHQECRTTAIGEIELINFIIELNWVIFLRSFPPLISNQSMYV